MRISFRITFVFSKVEPDLHTGSRSVSDQNVPPLQPFPVSCFPSFVSPLLSSVFCLLSPVSCFPSSVSPLLSSVFFLLSPVSCLLSPVTCLPYLVTSLPSTVSSHVSRAINAADFDSADLAVLWCKLADLGDLAILTLLADLAD